MVTPRCYRCGAPSVCFGADLANPRYRCPRHCHADHMTQHHGPAGYLAAHMAAEGVSLRGVA